MHAGLPVARDQSDQQVLDDVVRHGCHVVGVLADDQGPAYSYSIGLFRNFGHPEILVFGLNHPLMHSMINCLVAEIRGGRRFLVGNRYPGILEGFDCEFRHVKAAHYRELLGYARWFHGGEDFPVVQCVWPDKQGRFPWELGFNPQFKSLQPLYD